MLEERLGRNIEELRGVVEKATAEEREEQAQEPDGWSDCWRRCRPDGTLRTPRRTGSRLKSVGSSLPGERTATW